MSENEIKQYELRLAALIATGEYDKAERLVRHLLNEHQEQDIARARLLGGLAKVLSLKENDEEALSVSYDAVVLAYRCGDACVLVTLLDLRAEIRCFTGDFPGALRTLTAAEKYARDGSVYDQVTEASISHTRGMAYQGCGWWEAADLHLQKAKQYWGHLRMGEQLIRATGDLALVALRQAESEAPDSERLERSLDFLDSVGKHFQRAGNQLLVVQTAVNVLKVKGCLAMARRDSKSLWRIHSDYFSVMSQFGGQQGILTSPPAFGVLVDWTVGCCRVGRAWADLAGSTPEVGEILNGQEGLLEKALATAPRVQHFWLERAALHRCRAQHGLESAVAAADQTARCMEQALDILRESAADYTDPQVRAGWLGRASSFLQGLAEAAEFALIAVDPARTDIATRMVSLAQFLRARARRDLVRNLESLTQMRVEHNEIEDLLARINCLHRWLEQLDARRRDKPDSPARDLGALPTEPEPRRLISLEEVRADVLHRYPEYVSFEVRKQVDDELKYRKELLSRRAEEGAFLRVQSAQLNSESPFDLSLFQSDMSEGEVVLDYYVGPSALYVGVIGRNSLKVLRLPITNLQELNSLAQKISYLANETLRHGVANDSLVAGMRRCSNWLLPKELVALLTQLRTQRLYVVASGPLWRIPFAWLDADGKLALERWEICIVPSACLAGRDEDEQIHEQTVVIGHPGNPYLKFVGEEVKSVSGLLKCRSLFETEATPQRILREVLPEAGIIHFACHGFCDPASPLTSSLLLEPDDQHSDGRLMFYEILSVPLRAQVVSLGACHTAESEGPTSFPESLSHAFLGAGARFVIASFWAALDDEARNFAHDFYAALSQKAEPPVAFRQAQLQQVARLRSTSGRSDYASLSDRDFAEIANFVLLSARRM